MFLALKREDLYWLNLQRMLLTNAYVIFASVTNAVGSIVADHFIVTFETYNTTTVHICFILIFDFESLHVSGAEMIDLLMIEINKD